MEFYKRKLPPNCVSFCSSEGKDIFKDALLSGYMNCYFQLAAQFKTQEEPAYCGLSTLVMVLNALEIDPKKVWKGPWRWYHENMLDCCIPLDIIGKKGITMEQFACLAACNMLQMKMVHVDETASEEKFRDLVKIVTQQSDQVLVTAYSRITLEQTGDGHYSPIGGYNPDRDVVLIMDTARFKYPPHWVSLSMLFKAMQRIDPDTGLSRGYFLLSKNHFDPSLLFRLSSFFSPLGKDVELVSFFNNWEKLLATDLKNAGLTGSDVAELTIVEVIKLLGEIRNDVHLLTIQFNNMILEEHVIRMIGSLESLSLYKILLQKTFCTSQRVLSHAGFLPDINNLPEIDKVPQSEEIQATLKSITSVHFLALFILSWPYEECKYETIGWTLYKFVSLQLRQPDTEFLQKECARIRLQLSSIIGYVKKCSGALCLC